jgi:hypothetical protein
MICPDENEIDALFTKKVVDGALHFGWTEDFSDEG